MQGDALPESEAIPAVGQAAAVGWLDTFMNLIPGRKQQSSNEPSEEAIKRTQDYLRYASWVLKLLQTVLHYCTCFAVALAASASLSTYALLCFLHQGARQRRHILRSQGRRDCQADAGRLLGSYARSVLCVV